MTAPSPCALNLEDGHYFLWEEVIVTYLVQRRWLQSTSSNSDGTQKRQKRPKFLTDVGSGRKKITAQKRSRPTDDVSEYDESDQEYTEFEYWNNNVEVAKASKKGKEFAIASEPGKKNPPRGKKKLGGIEIREPTFGQAPYQGVDDDYMNIDSKRIGVFCQRSCIGERHVAVQSLLEESPEFALLFEQGHLEQICDFSEQTGYCMQLVRTFYLCGGHLRDDLGGPLEFTTTVRGTEMKITLTTVAAALGMETNVVDLPYLQGHLQSLNDWRRVVNGVCLPDTMSTGNSVFSKELRPEYRILNFIVCYNILLTMQTKVILWERLLYMYLVGHPTEARGLNLNIPYLIWTRMTKDVRSTSQHERLPFPMIIMRILRNHNVNTHSTSYEHSLGTINETTIVKSGPPRPAAEVPSASRPFVETSEEDASVTSIYRKQQRLSIEQERLSSKLQKISAEQKKISKKLGKLSRITKVIFDKLGCCSADIPPQDDDSD